MCGIIQEPPEFRAISTAAVLVIDVLGRDVPVLGRGELSQMREVILRILPVVLCADEHIDCRPHYGSPKGTIRGSGM